MPWSKVGNLTPGGGPTSPAETYTRPTDWLTLPTVNAGDQKVVGLHAVFPYEGGNFAALSCAGNFTVDWGDGTAPESFAANVQANHLYTYATLSAATGTTRGYRQAIVTITPQAGQTLTVINLGKKHPQTNLPVKYSTSWLDLCMAGASVTTLQLGMDTGSAATVSPGLLEQIEYVGPSAITSMSYLFGNCYALQSIKGAQFTANVTTADQLLYNCTSLKTLADLNLSKIATGTSLFATNKILQRVSGVNLSGMDQANQMFENCTALLEVTNVNVSLATNLTAMFNGCTSLRSVSGLNVAGAYDYTNLFNGCTSLLSVTGLTTTNANNLFQMFYGCTALRTVALFDTAKATSFNSMFGNCFSLQQVPAFNTVKGTNFGSMFVNCASLTAIPALNMAVGTTLASFVSGCPSLSSVAATGIKAAISFIDCRLSGPALDALYSQLATVSGIVITVTRNYGTPTDTPSIATGKGWTVTGT